MTDNSSDIDTSLTNIWRSWRAFRQGKKPSREIRAFEQKLVLLKLSQKASSIYQKKSPVQKRIIISKLFKEFNYKGGILSVNYTKFARAIANNVIRTHQIIGG